MPCLCARVRETFRTAPAVLPLTTSPTPLSNPLSNAARPLCLCPLLLPRRPCKGSGEQGGRGGTQADGERELRQSARSVEKGPRDQPGGGPLSARGEKALTNADARVSPKRGSEPTSGARVARRATLLTLPTSPPIPPFCSSNRPNSPSLATSFLSFLTHHRVSPSSSFPLLCSTPSLFSVAGGGGR